ncbi:glycosyltransferase involved in cell wall biosynthesis [Sphingopyxis panaciterrae]|uniref:glycosyltransferase family 4 protein n=1 Tax=Sphingopyxis panaciterrae TaxID=363841 RepID=UPI0014205656|nr:glycosyltransferase family 4 protein [Sphingopyxis panaciterrae]NIJ37102.1 glycosyltransferase involved in cell wall biosynthesis [Sphingopyxis panaciterrae]
MKYDFEDKFLPRFPEEDVHIGAALADTPRLAGPRIALIGCFRPRQCGIATYTADIYDHLAHENPEIGVDVYAMRADASPGSDPAIAAHIDAADRASYRDAAAAIERSGADAVWLQHEFGIFGGTAGELILDLVDRIAVPLIVTFHTVLAEPSDAQRGVMDHIVAHASRLIVMSEFGRRTLIDIYGAGPDAVTLIEHGTPVRDFVAHSPLRETLAIGARPVLSTFGLLGQGKGLETAIRALPVIAAEHPDILYRIVGATHPNLVAAEGEAYRESLKALAEELGVGANVTWENRFLDTAELLDQIEICDIYLAPYPNLAQVTSGTLAYAVALGRAVVSTPFIHARELLADDVGILVPRGSSDAIAAAVLALLASPDDRRALQARAYDRGRRTAWPEIIRQSAILVGEVVAGARYTSKAGRAAPSLDGVGAMCDDVGILQHGCGIVPDRAHGYCVDDNARALMLFNGMEKGPSTDAQLLRFASFIQHAWNDEVRGFRNFMGYDRRWLEERGSDDSNGRAIWALGHCAAHARSHELREWGRRWFGRAGEGFANVRSPRAIAFATLGAEELLARFPDDMVARALVETGGAFLDGLASPGETAGWDWFEPMLAYDNARLPEALIRAGARCDRADWSGKGLRMLEWLCDRQTAAGGHFRAIGSQGFGLAGETLPFDQQPLEAWATIGACGAAFEKTGAKMWREYAEAAYRWFLGANDRGVPLASVRTGRCCDGLTPQGVNSNVGAESTLAFHLAYQMMDTLFWSGGAREDVEIAHADLQT